MLFVAYEFHGDKSTALKRESWMTCVAGIFKKKKVILFESSSYSQ